MDEEKKLDQNETEAVSGGADMAVNVQGGINFGGVCRHYVCDRCGAVATDSKYKMGICVWVDVHHASWCNAEETSCIYCVNRKGWMCKEPDEIWRKDK